MKRLHSCFALAVALTAFSAFGQNTFPQSGNVGIGTTTPAAPLHIVNSQNGGTVLRIDNPDTTDTSSYAGLLLSQNGTIRALLGSLNDGNTSGAGGPGALQLWNFQNANILIGSGSTERMRITPAGFVGIGITAPEDRLHLAAGGGMTMETGGARGRVLSEAADSIGMTMNAKLVNGGWVQDNTAKPSWIAKIDSSSTHDGFTVYRAGAGSPTYTTMLSIDPAGNLTVPGRITGSQVIGAVYQDVAEWVPATEKMEPGTVVVLNRERNNEVTPSTRAYDTAVAGVVSAQPGVILGVASDTKSQVATTGRVKVKVDATRGAINVGDLLVTSDSSGTAMKSQPVDLGGVAIHRPGTLIGKALEPLASGKGEILVLLSLQ